MGNSESDLNLAAGDMSNSGLGLTEILKYKKMDGCFILKVRKLKVPEKSLQRIKSNHPDINLAELQLLLSFRGQSYMLQTLKKDFHMLNQPEEFDRSSSPCGHSTASPQRFPKIQKHITVPDMDKSQKQGGNVNLQYDTFNMTQSEGHQIKEDDIFQVNCNDLVIEDKFTFQLASIKRAHTDSSSSGKDLLIYESTVLAEREMPAQQLIFSNLESLSVDLKATPNLLQTQESMNELMQSEIVTYKDQKESKKKKKDKVGSLKFKVSFMRGKFFEQQEVSNVLLTKEEQMRLEKLELQKVEVELKQLEKMKAAEELKLLQMAVEMTSEELTPWNKQSDQNVPFQIRHYSQSAPHQHEAGQLLEDYFQKNCDPMSDEHLKERENADPDEETHNGSCSYGIQRTQSETNFFDFTPAQVVQRQRSTFHKTKNTVYEEDEGDESSQSEDSKKRECRRNENLRGRRPNKLVQRYNNGSKLTINSPISKDNYMDET